MISGVEAGLLETGLFFIISTGFHMFIPISNITYYWLTFTILTGVWEFCYIINNQQTINYSKFLLENKQHSWTNKYDYSVLLPWNLSRIFYGEYGAYADKEYMTKKDNWSRLIEGTHACCCALFSLTALIYYCLGNENKFYLALGFSMGTQLLNSLLYLGQYYIQMNDIIRILISFFIFFLI